MTMKSGRMPVSSIALQMPMNSQGWPMHSLKPTGLPPDSSRSRAMKCIISIGVAKAEWRGRRNAVDADRHAARRGDFRRHLGAGQHAAVAGLGALRQLDLDHLDLRLGAPARRTVPAQNEPSSLRQPK